MTTDDLYKKAIDDLSVQCQVKIASILKLRGVDSFKDIQPCVQGITPYTVSVARSIASMKHSSQIDKAGQRYFLHPQCVARSFRVNDHRVVGYLHDIIEDTDITAKGLLAMGIPAELVTAISLLTHDKGTAYPDYIRNICTNQLAFDVKLADLKHNTDISRLRYYDEKANKRMLKYIDALTLMEDTYKISSKG